MTFFAPNLPNAPTSSSGVYTVAQAGSDAIAGAQGFFEETTGIDIRDEKGQLFGLEPRM